MSKISEAELIQKTFEGYSYSVMAEIKRKYPDESRWHHMDRLIEQVQREFKVKKKPLFERLMKR